MKLKEQVDEWCEDDKSKVGFKVNKWENGMIYCRQCPSGTGIEKDEDF